MLSVGARVVLIKHVLSAIPIYTLLSQDPPKTILQKIETILANFFWGASDMGRKKHWTTWKRLCYPTEEDGLGFRRLKDVVRAIHIKIWWKFRQSSSIWAKFMHKKYQKGLEHPLQYSKKTAAPSTWRLMKSIGPLADSQIGFRIRNGNTCFFNDCWNLKHKLSDSAEWTLYPAMSFNQVKLLPPQDALRMDILERLSPDDQKLFSDMVMDSDMDQIFWQGSSSGCFKLSDTWNWIRQKRAKDHTRAYIWSARIPLKISVFMWRLLHSWIPTHDNLKKCRICLPSKCFFCESEETVNHLFITCKFASEIWAFFEHILCIFPRKSYTVLSKLQTWWKLKFTSADHEVLHLLVSLILWEIWKARNCREHDGDSKPISKICDAIILSIRTISEAKPFPAISNSVKGILHVHSNKIHSRVCRIFSWTPPEINRVKLNVDGSTSGILGDSGGGGIIRNSYGTPLFGFSSYYGRLSCLAAECRALQEGIQLCIRHGYLSVEVEIDSLFLCQMITGATSAAWQLDNVIRQIKQSMADHNFSFKHILREANSAADFLAKQGRASHLSYSFDRQSIPHGIKGMVALDAIQFPYTRIR